MLNSFDLYVEKTLTDRGVDSSASKKFAREVNDTDMRWILERSETFRPQDKASLASVSLMAGASIFFMGLGAAAFSIFDQMDRRNLRNMLDDETGGKFRPDKASRGVFGRIKKMQEASSKALLPLGVMSLDATGYLTGGKKKPHQTRYADQMLFLRADGRQFASRDLLANGNYLAEGRSWLKASKLLKRKRFIEDQIEKASNGNNLGLVSRLRSRIEKLDKELIKLGC